MKKIATLILLIAVSGLSAQFRCQELKQSIHQGPVYSIDNSAKSDTFNILHYELQLDLTSLPQRHLEGVCSIDLVSLQPNSGIIELDLLQLQVDSVVQNGNALNYTHNDTILNVQLNPAPQPGDTLQLQVYYGGTPPADASGWGGWHQQNGYFYNLGVGFAANPHTFGRAWHPCFDNFVEKATYDFHVKTVKPLRPYCNGIRSSETGLAGDTILTTWQMTDSIPTYLASIAVSNYVEIRDTVQSLLGQMPIALMVKPADSSQVIASFVNLKPSFQALEKAFGPYYWQKIGYCATTVGAMEHATSIHFPTNLINGNLSGEDIMVHELAHHWFGNLVTCQTDADMWINEGLAEFSSQLYTEELYGRKHYLDVVRDNAYFVLEEAHKRDNGYRAIYNLPHEYVYGTHVYQKGAMVGHNLRAYLGDSLFFSGITQLLANNKYDNLSTAEFRDELSQITGKNLNDFFDDWVLNPGFPSVSVDSLYVPRLSQLNVADVKVSQRLNHAQGFFKGLPVQISFFSATGDTATRSLVMNQAVETATFQPLPFQPVFALASYSGKLLTGDTYDRHIIHTNTSLAPNFSKMRITASNVQDSLELICMYHWAGPGGKTGAGVEGRLSRKRYWTIQGIDLENADLSARVDINGSEENMDPDLLGQTADSLVVLYRKDATEDWTYWPQQTKTAFAAAGSYRGWMEIDSLQAGDYSLANVGDNIGVEELPGKQGSIEVFPNPATGRLKLRFSEKPSDAIQVKVTDLSGQMLYRHTHKLDGKELNIDLPGFSSEMVIVQVGDHVQKVALR